MYFLKGTTPTTKFLVISLSAILSALLSMKIALTGLLTLIMLDLLTGIAKSMYVNKRTINPLKRDFWTSIKSYMLRKTWKKAYEYGIGILVVVVFESLVFGGSASIEFMSKSFSLAELSVLIPALVEVWSIFENMEVITETNFLKRMLQFLPKKLKDALKNNN